MLAKGGRGAETAVLGATLMYQRYMGRTEADRERGKEDFGRSVSGLSASQSQE